MIFDRRLFSCGFGFDMAACLLPVDFMILSSFCIRIGHTHLRFVLFFTVYLSVAQIISIETVQYSDWSAWTGKTTKFQEKDLNQLDLDKSTQQVRSPVVGLNDSADVIYFSTLSLLPHPSSAHINFENADTVGLEIVEVERELKLTRF